MLLMMSAAYGAACWSGGKTTVKYESAAELVAEEAQAARVELREPAPTPAGGQLVVTIARHTIAAADLQYHSVIVEQSGVEVLRQTGTRSVPHPSNPPGSWWDLMVVSLPQDVPRPFTVHVVDGLQSIRCTFTVTAKDRVQFVTVAK